ncbi:MAG: hypothetical protein SV062_10235 [Thermodesulfobacteriota bacterium]|nr:hypothetical protein [Thermodesulfobacteriota bacterium]
MLKNIWHYNKNLFFILIFLFNISLFDFIALHADDLPCNGYPELCSKRYDEVAYPTTHNAFDYAYGPEFWFPPNQQFPITRQLEDGVRGLMIDIYEFNGIRPWLKDEIYVCHGYCSLGGEPLVDVLGYVKEFLDNNPREVVTLIFECYVDHEPVVDAFDESGLISYVHSQTEGEMWPTLAEMIQNNKRLVVFTDKDGGSPDWYHDVWEFAVETHWDNKERSDLTCDFNRGDPDNDLFIINHFLTKPLARRTLSLQVNFNPFLINRLEECRDTTGKVPNFVTVDFYAFGDLFEAVNIINGVE